MKTPVTRLSSLVLVAAAAMAAAAAEPSARPTKAARAEDAARAVRLAAWSEGLRTNANPRTQAQFRDEVFLPFWRRQTVEPFLAGPEGREPWAPEAVRLMEREIFELWNTSLVDCSGTPGIGKARDRSDLIEFVERVRTKDPFLLFLRAAAFREETARHPPLRDRTTGMTAETREMLAVARELADRPGAELSRLLIAGLRGRFGYGIRSSREPEAAELAAEWLAAASPSADECRAATFLLFDLFRDDARRLPARVPLEELADALERSGRRIDPWIVAIVRGRAEAERGFWNSGCSGREYGKRAAECFSRAKPELAAAWALRHDPVSASLLLRIAAEEGSDDVESWLARATDAEIDTRYAYWTYVCRVCRPTRPGGAARLRRFADAMRGAGHEDCMPGEYEAAFELWLCALAGIDAREAFSSASETALRCGRAAERVFRSDGLNRQGRQFAATVASAFAYYRGDFVRAGGLQREAGAGALPDFDEVYYPASGELAVALAGLSGTNAPALAALEEARRTNDWERVRAAAATLLGPRGGLSPEETRLAAWRAEEAAFRAGLPTGEWMPLRFRANGVFANAVNRGWEAGEDWIAPESDALDPDGSSRVRANCLLRFLVPLPDRIELRGTLDWIPVGAFDATGQPRFASFSLRDERAAFVEDWPAGEGDVRLDWRDPAPIVGGHRLDKGPTLSLVGIPDAPWTDRSREGVYALPSMTNRIDFRIEWRAPRLSVWIGADETPYSRALSFDSPERKGPFRLQINGLGVRLSGLEVRDPAAPRPADDGPRRPRPPPPADPGTNGFADPFGILANARTNAAMRTWSGFFRDSLGPLLRRELVAPFEAGPEAGAPWADEARIALESTVRLAWYDRMSVQFPDEWEPAARLVLERGATDPGLRWMAAMGLAAQGRGDEAREQVRALREAVAGDGGTPFLRYLAALADWRVDGRARDEAERLGVAWAESLADRPQDSRAVLHLLRQDLDLARLAPLLEASGADPWLALVARGVAEGATAEGAPYRWEGNADAALEYGRRFAASRDAFERAWTLHPEFPEPGFEMARLWRDRLALGDYMRWIRRGLAAEADHAGLLRLCVRFVHPTMAAPGSDPFRRAARAFGRALVDAGRSDTQLSAFGVEQIAAGAVGAPAGSRLGECDEDVRRIEATADALRGRDVAGWRERDLAQAFAALCAHWRGEPDVRADGSRRMRHALHREAPDYGRPRYAEGYGSEIPRLDAVAYLMSLAGPNAESFAELERIRRTGGPEAVLRFADELSASPPRAIDEAESRWLFAVRTAAWLESRFSRGEPLRATYRFHGVRTLCGPGVATPADDVAVFSGPDGSDRSFIDWNPGFPRDLRIEGTLSGPTNAPPGETNVLGVFRTGASAWTPGENVSIRFAVLEDRVGAAAVSDGDRNLAVDYVWTDRPGRDVPFRVEWRRGWIRAWIGDGDRPVVETDSFRSMYDRLEETSCGVFLRGEHVVVGALAVRAPLGAAPGEEQPEGALPRFRTVLLPGGVPLELAWCPAGSFEEGFWELERQGWTGENPAPRRTAELTRGFWIARCETTRAQWRAATGEDAPGDGAPDAPVAASWDEAAAFAERLGAVAPQEGLRWALPTETQWERAARAGREGPLDPVALGEALAPAAGAGPRPAGAARANPWGVWDLCGNAREWCADDYAPRASIDPVRDPTPARLAPGAPKAVRGGAADSAHTAELTPGFRAGRVRELRVPSIGFRVILEEDPSLSTNAQ